MIVGSSYIINASIKHGKRNFHWLSAGLLEKNVTKNGLKLNNYNFLRFFSQQQPGQITNIFTGSFGMSKRGAVPIRGKAVSPSECGEDSFCISENEKEVVLGVADGVGSWAESGYNPGLFAQSLMHNLSTFVKEYQDKDDSLKSLLQKAFSKLVKDSENLEKRQKPIGSSTACVASICKHDLRLKYANFGDSAMVIISRKSSESIDSLGVSFETKPLQRGFNWPYQLTLYPSGSSEFESDDVETSTEPINLKTGDIVMVLTDGVLDNFSSKKLVQIVKRTLDSEPVKLCSSKTEVARILAEEVALEARTHSEDPNNKSPFSKESAKMGYSHKGGKKDDITVVVALID